MKISHFSTYAAGGGAANQSLSLHRALLCAGVNSSFNVSGALINYGSHVASIEHLYRASLPAYYARYAFCKFFTALDARLSGAQDYRSTTLLPTYSKSFFVPKSAAHIIHLHWISNEFYPIRQLRAVRNPAVWTLHDLWPFLGFHHVYSSSTRHGTLLEKYSRKLLTDVLQRKPITFVAPSAWIGQVASNFSINPRSSINIIPHAIDTCVFSSSYPPRVKLATTKYLLFSSYSDLYQPVKGFHLIEQALAFFLSSRPSIKLLILSPSRVTPRQLPENSYEIAPFTSDRHELANIYRSCSATLCPSVSESFGLTACESISCGTPVVAFRGTGLDDVIVDGRTGYLCKRFDSHHFISSIDSILCSEDNFCSRLDLYTHQQKFSYERMAESYISLYSSVKIHHE